MRVFLADDDPHCRSAMRLALEDEPGIVIVGEWTTCAGLVEQVALTRASVVLLDWDLPGLRSDGYLDRLRSARPDCRLVVLSVRPEQREDALRAGVSRFVCKGDAPDTLLSTVRGLDAGDPQQEPDQQPEGDVRRPEPLEIVQDRVQ